MTPVEDPTPPSAAKRFVRWLDSRYAQDLPEMELFPSQEHRARAVDEANGEILKTLSILDAVIGFVFFLVATRIAQWFLERIFPNAGAWRPTLAIAAGAVAVWGLLGWYMRHQIRRRVRLKLVDMGVPVCLSCGYRLSGMIERCSECGNEIDARVLRVLRYEESQPLDVDATEVTEDPKRLT